MAMIAGCTASPYDLAEQDAATIQADIRQAIDKCINEANGVASAQDGKVYVNVKKFDRAIAFVPIPEPEQQWSPLIISYTPPKNAVLKKWTDRFALAQELSYRYSYVKILESNRHFSPPYFTAKVKVLIKIISRHAYEGKPKDTPIAPDGYMVWEPAQSYSLDGTGWLKALPAPSTPHGEEVTPSLAIDAISQSALDSLRKISPRESEYAIIARMAYDHSKKRWKLAGARNEKDFAEPEWLSWNHGLEGDRARYVLSPGEIRRRKSSRKPAPKE